MKVTDYLTANPLQYFATVGADNKPKVRPFQFMLEKDGKLWFCTGNQKQVFEELKANPFVELCVSAPDFSWLRLSGKAVFSDNIDIKNEIIETHPLVKSIYGTGTNPTFEAFYLEDAVAVFADFGPNPPQIIHL